MTPEAQERWNEDDEELEIEFEDVVSSYRNTRGGAPRVPSALDGKIREMARYHIGEELRESWVFGHIPQISLVAGLFFGVGVYFSWMLENEPGLDNDASPVIVEAPIQPSANDAELLRAARSSAPDYTARNNSQVNPGRENMPVPASLDSLIGTWTGTNSLWLEPEAEPQQSDVVANISSVAQGRFLKLAYTWSFEGRPQEGILLIGSAEGGVQASWVDSFHMGDRIMTCEGTEPSAGGVAVTGTYAAPPGPDWGWRIELRPVSGDAFQMLMFNITPAGEEGLAVQADFRRDTP